MMRILMAVPIVLAGLLVYSQAVKPQPSLIRSELVGVLDFEADHKGDVPTGWDGSPPETVAVDGQTVHGGRWAVRIERTDSSPNAFTLLSKSIPVDFAGTKLELRGFLRTENVSDFTGLLMRQEDDGGSIAFDNMQRQQLKGTTDWTAYSIVMPINAAARRVTFGVLASGTGRVWADDLRLLVDDKPIEIVPRVERAKTVLDLDQDFDAGSGIAMKDLTGVQIANLAMLGKVWGFLKYHHPAVVGGKRNWDYELLRVLPQVLAAADSTAARAAISQWVTALGTVPACGPCATLNESQIHLPPHVTWLTDEGLGAELAAALRAVHRNRPTTGKQFYVSLAPNARNPAFEHEQGYKSIALPDTGYQLLALYRFWNIIEYWFPYRDVIGGNWDDELADFIPRVALAKDGDSYKRQMMALIARVHDTHANLWSSLDVRPPTGACQIPVTMRFVEGTAVVTGYSNAQSGPSTGLRVGDVVTALDGVAVADLVERWTPFYAASNQPTRLRDIARSMTRGSCGEATVRVLRDRETLELKPARVAESRVSSTAGRTNDRRGETFQKLSPDVAYLKLSSVQQSQAASYIRSADGTKGLIIDIRNYPSEFVVFALGSLLVDRPTEFARFTRGDLVNPGAFHWDAAISLQPAAPRYKGKIVILIDESSQSQAEYTTMAFRSAPNATVVGSTTAGADGNVSAIPLPGGLRSMISGIGVFYPDKRPTQRIGIVADVEAKPTIQGIRSGRDEVLEAALRQILGPETPAAEIERLARQ
jgi:C-terminal processing protease CtpA/Prc